MDIHKMLPHIKGEKPVDLVIKNAKIVNVFTGEIEADTLAIHEGVFVGFGDYQGKEVLDLKGAYIAPGLIDGHVHIESSMLTPSEFAKIIMPKGTTTIIADPHEIGNVSGVKGIEFILASSHNIPLDVHIMVPSCVPATEFENTGASIGVDDIKKLALKQGVLGLGEVMDYPAVLSGEKTIHQKIRAMQPRPIDGHAPDIIGHDLNAYIASGVQTDHECTQTESMLERIRRGMYVHLREGSATRNESTLLKAVTDKNDHRILFCTDDKHPEDIIREGHINYNVNLAINAGLDPVRAIRMATLNAAQCYKLTDVGAIGVGYKADFIVFKDITAIEPVLVYKEGKKVAEAGKPCFKTTPLYDEAVHNTVHIDVDKLDFTLRLSHEHVRVIGLVKNNITTTSLTRKVNVENGVYAHSPQSDLLKIALIERHKHTGNIGLGLVEGYGIKNGAVAMSIAHDSHNVIVIGDQDESMKLAVKKLTELQGGIVVVENKKIIDFLQLEIAGIMTSQAPDKVSKKLVSMNNFLTKMGLSEAIDDPFITLAFLSLPVIPELKLTDQGLFDVKTFKNVSINVEVKS